MKKVVVFGGGTGLSNLLEGLKKQDNLNISVVVTIADNGESTGQIRNFYDLPAPGDIRRAVIALSDNEVVKELMEYRFDENIDHHTIGNLVLTALTQINGGKMTDSVKKYCEMLNVDEKIVPISNESLELCAKMQDGSIIVGESEISHSDIAIDEIFYQGFPKISEEVVKLIDEADALILSSGSLYTSIMPNIVFSQMYKLLKRDNLEIIYVSNIVTQAGETDNYSVSDHINALNKHLVNKEVDVVFSNKHYDINQEIIDKYAQEKSQLVKIDYENIECQVFAGDYVKVTDMGHLRHDVDKIGSDIYQYLKGDYES